MADVVISTGLTVEVTVAMLFDSASGLFDSAEGLFDDMDYDDATLVNTEVLLATETGVVSGALAQKSKVRSRVLLTAALTAVDDQWLLVEAVASNPTYTDIDPAEVDIYSDIEGV